MVPPCPSSHCRHTPVRNCCSEGHLFLQLLPRSTNMGEQLQSGHYSRLQFAEVRTTGKGEMMEQVVRIVVSCSDRKSIPPSPDLRLGAYVDDLAARSARWIDRIGHPVGETIPARHLYKGEHWSVVRQLPAAGAESGCTVELWVASAGYGLIHIDDPLEPYAATFATRNADSITRPNSSSSPSSDARFWWEQLTERRRASSRPDSLRSLVRQMPDAPLVVALSGSYIRAVEQDLVDAAKEFTNPNNLLIVASGMAASELQRYRVPADARFQQSLGGTRMSLNARIAKRLVERARQHCWEVDEIHRHLSEELAGLDHVPTFDRQTMTDREVVAFIKRTFAAHGRLPQTKLLRQLRDDNRDCEQKRFARLYLSVLEEAI